MLLDKNMKHFLQEVGFLRICFYLKINIDYPIKVTNINVSNLISSGLRLPSFPLSYY
jgi:hypothetical protein